MSRRFVVAAVVLAAGLVTIPGAASRAQNPGGDAPRKPVGVTPDPALLKIVSTLHNQKITGFEGDLSATSLTDILNFMSKRYDLPFIIMTEEFRNEPNPSIADAKPRLSASRLDGLTVYRFLTTVLGSMGAVLMVRNDHIEILPRDAVLREAGLPIPPRSDETGPPVGPINPPLVNVVVVEKPLPEVLTELARVYDVNVVVEARVQKDLKDVVVTERLLNVPADTALELLSGQAGLSVVRKGNTFRITAGPAN